MDWLARREELISVRAREPDVRRISLSSTGQGSLYWLSVGALPALVALLGGLVAFKRRS